MGQSVNIFILSALHSLGTLTPKRKKKGLTMMKNSPSIKDYLLKMKKMNEGPTDTENQEHTEEVRPVMNLSAPKQTKHYEKKRGRTGDAQDER